MNILTPQNAHHGILVRQTAKRTLHRLIQLPNYREWWIAPKGTFKYERLPTEQFHRYEMVEEAPEIPLVALGPDSAALTQKVPQAGTESAMEAMGGFVDELGPIVEAIYANSVSNNIIRALCESAFPLVKRMSSIIAFKLGDKASSRTQPSPVDLDRLYELVEELELMAVDIGGYLYDKPEALAISRAMVPKFTALLARLNTKENDNG